MKRSQRKRQRQIAEKEHRSEELGRRQGESKEQKEQLQLQAEPYEENNVSKKLDR